METNNLGPFVGSIAHIQFLYFSVNFRNQHSSDAVIVGEEKKKRLRKKETMAIKKDSSDGLNGQENRLGTAEITAELSEEPAPFKPMTSAV
jgi:hypothetical protein